MEFLDHKNVFIFTLKPNQKIYVILWSRLRLVSGHGRKLSQLFSDWGFGYAIIHCEFECQRVSEIKEATIQSICSMLQGLKKVLDTEVWKSHASWQIFLNSFTSLVKGHAMKHHLWLHRNKMITHSACRPLSRLWFICLYLWLT